MVEACQVCKVKGYAKMDFVSIYKYLKTKISFLCGLACPVKFNDY